MIHILPTAPLAERVLLPGDPARAMRLAVELIDGPKMFNHNRGLWGYSGTAHDGEPLTVQSTGMGGPSAAIVVHELITLGARRLVRVGTCAALDPALALGELVIGSSALCTDGTSRALGAGERASAAPEIVQALGRAAGDGIPSGLIVTCDLFYDRGVLASDWTAAGALAVDMESSVLFTLGARRGVGTGSLLVVADVVGDEPIRIEPEALHESELRMGRLALAALGEPHELPPPTGAL